MDNKQLFIIIQLLVLSTVSCNTSSDDQSDQVQPKHPAVNQQTHMRPLRNLTPPDPYRKRYPYCVIVTDAAGRPLQKATVQILFHAKDERGNKLEYGQCYQYYTYKETTDKDGVAHFDFPSLLVESYPTEITVSSQNCSAVSEDSVYLNDDGKKTINMWCGDQFNAAKNADPNGKK
jgi:hypothetical protein